MGSTLESNANLYKKIFELGRRMKVVNPGLMRGTYGKLQKEPP